MSVAVGYPVDAGHNVGHRRGMQQRSYSTTAADNFAAREGSRGRSQHSDSRLPRLDAASEERIVYIRPPLDSSVENSMNNGMYPMEEVGFEVKPPHNAAPCQKKRTVQGDEGGVSSCLAKHQLR